LIGVTTDGLTDVTRVHVRQERFDETRIDPESSVPEWIVVSVNILERNMLISCSFCLNTDKEKKKD